MRIRGFTLLLFVAALATAATSWATIHGPAARAALTGAASLAALSLVLVFRTQARTSPRASDLDALTATHAGPGHRHPRTRSSRRLISIETQLEQIREQLDAQQATLFELARTLRGHERQSAERTERLQQSLDDYQREHSERRARLEQSQQEHVERLQQTVVTHKDALAALERAVGPPAHHRAPGPPSRTAPG